MFHFLLEQLGFDWRRKQNSEDGGDGETSAKIDILQLAKEAEEKKASKGRATDDETWNTRL